VRCDLSLSLCELKGFDGRLTLVDGWHRDRQEMALLSLLL